MNLISLNFLECSPSPSMGYTVWWKVAGTFTPFSSAGTFFNSPAIFYDTSDNPPDTDYEGYIVSNCRGVSGNPVFWSTIVQESSSGGSSAPGSNYSISLTTPCGINSSYLVEGGNPGDIVVVQAAFYGSITKIGGLFTRADLSINSPDGTSDSDSSTCYTDTSPHFVSVISETTITMVGTTAVVNLSAVVHNSLDSSMTVTLTILTVNGSYNGAFCAGCKGNSATGGTC